MEQHTVTALFDELEKIAMGVGALRQAAHAATKASGRNLSMEAQALHRQAWMREQAIRKAMAPRVKAYQAAKGRTTARLPATKKPGFLSSLFGGKPAVARA